ncbi:MAG: SpoIIE family protein phosphatase [Leptospiraceae bacterium]|nr:SpoIIE family protein phosphatase [Leptospiraceae bacterium]MCP5511941.1 SpoIIE family protein phosphatase [Leptospiraceae bacterium]
MNLLENVFVNYPFISTLENTILFFLTSIFVFKIQNRSLASTFLMVGFAFGAIAGLGYVFTHGIYGNSSIFRIITLSGILFNFALYPQFILHFPKLDNPKFSKYLMITHFSINIILIIYLISITMSRRYFFKIDGEYFEYDFPDYLKVYGLVTLIYILTSVFSALWRVFTLKGRDKYYMFILLIGLIIALLVPGIFNVLNKLGHVDRGTYLVVLSLFTLTGNFIILVAFINRTMDKTTFMVKILGVSFLVFMVIYNFFSYYAIGNRDEVYLQMKIKDLPNSIAYPEEVPDLSYRKVYDPISESLIMDYNPSGLQFDTYEDVDIHKVYYKSFVLQTLTSGKNPGEVDILYFHSDLNQATKEFLIPYHKAFLSKYTGDRNEISIEEKFKEIEVLLLKKYNTVVELPEKQFSERVRKLFNDETEELKPFQTAIFSYLEDHPDLSDFELKKAVLHFLKPIPGKTERIFRESSSDQSHHFSLIYYNPHDQKYYEMGFKYLEYRKFIHEEARIFLYLLFFALVLIFMGTPIFLSRALIMPLNELLDGLRKVRKGKLDTEIKVYVQDEIGFLSTSFNSMVKSIHEGKMKLEEYSNHLEEKVEERTKELTKSLDEINKLKVQQDGDYFLTSLLLKPFSSTSIQGEKILIDSHVKQKKEFSFRGKNYEIGGDLCVAYEIFLRGKKYLVFLNADAMGKSIQGAGGILVLGSVFQSIVQRTQSYPYLSEMSPEKWLKSAFKEMNKIFESFDGSMLISLIIGLIDESTGFLYYLNAEHPWIVLYRDGIADFIENEMYFRKLGSPGLNNELFISTFQMKEGDFIIMGSDGKDDLVLERSEESRVINEDETLFLKRVEEAGGDLKKIYSNINENFELMDDFSILTIRYPINEKVIDEHSSIQEKAKKLEKSENPNLAIKELKNLLTNYPNLPEITSALVKLYLRIKDFANAAEMCRIYLSKNDTDSSMMLKASYIMKKNHELDDAIDLAERIRLREPYNVRNLVHLADMFAYKNNYHRARKMLQKIFRLEPENQSAHKIVKMIEANDPDFSI